MVSLINCTSKYLHLSFFFPYRYLTSLNGRTQTIQHRLNYQISISTKSLGIVEGAGTGSALKSKCQSTKKYRGQRNTSMGQEKGGQRHLERDRDTDHPTQTKLLLHRYGNAVSICDMTQNDWHTGMVSPYLRIMSAVQFESIAPLQV